MNLDILTKAFLELLLRILGFFFRYLNTALKNMRSMNELDIFITRFVYRKRLKFLYMIISKSIVHHICVSLNIVRKCFLFRTILYKDWFARTICH